MSSTCPACVAAKAESDQIAESVQKTEGKKKRAKSQPTDIMESLRAKGLRRTSQRRDIWDFFAASPRGLTAGEAARGLKTSGVGQATVYRTVKALAEMGYLRVVGGGDENEKRYVASRPGHVHLLTCRRCGRAEEVRDCNLATLEKLLSVQTGFTVDGHSLEFFGVCPACQNAQPPASAEAPSLHSES